MKRTVGRNEQPSPAGDAFMRTLRVDHGRLSRVLREIDIQQARLAAAPVDARPVLVEAMHYLLHYQHAFHHPREDRLFERISARAPRLGREMRELMREHRGGLRQAERLAADLAGATLPQLRRGLGVRLAGRLDRYVAHTRDHMRSEEAVFYAQSERVLTDADWASLQAQATPDDPLGDPVLLARKYPRLAARLVKAVSGVPGHGDTPPAGWGAMPHRARGAVSDGVEQLFELYGELLHEALDLARTNLASLQTVRSPWGFAHVAGPIGTRSCRFAVRCLTEPPRLALAAFARVGAALRESAAATARQPGSQ
jgi:hemerythrin-like domain-containing protein